MSEDVVNEKTTSILTITFKDETGANVTPSSATYRIDDDASKTAIKATTSFSPSGPTHDLTITSNENRIVGTEPYEHRTVTIEFDYGTGPKHGTADYHYVVANLYGVS